MEQTYNEIEKQEENTLTMCGYCCALCKAFAPNIHRKDERAQLSMMWKKYYDLAYEPDAIYCEGCRCKKPEAKRIDMNCPVRKCVMEKKLEHCGACEAYPCDTFKLREGMDMETAKQQLGELFSANEYTDYLSAYDNSTRLDEYKKRQNLT